MTEHALSAILQPYAATEYLPHDMILPALSAAFPSFCPVISYTAEHLMGKVTAHDLLAAPLVNWRLNRPPDPTRYHALAQYLQRSGEPIDSVIHAALNHRTRQIEILDGAHRWQALKALHPLPSFELLINIRINHSEGKLVEVFQNINKSVSVPELYLRDSSKDRRTCIERIATAWQMRYPSHFRSTKAPQRPNTNRDLWIGFLDYAYEKMGLTYETEKRLAERLEEMNQAVKADVPEKIRVQCEASGCYLFTKRMGELEMMI